MHIYYLGSYILGRITLITVPWMWPISEGNAKGSVANIDFYGPKSFVEDCLSAINETLPQYDEALKENFIKDKVSLHFYYEDKGLLTYPTVGLYSIPKNVAHFQAEGICQYIVFRYFLSSQIGMGLLAALKDNPKKHIEMQLTAKKKMADWLLRTKYPTRWLEFYK